MDQRPGLRLNSFHALLVEPTNVRVAERYVQHEEFVIDEHVLVLAKEANAQTARGVRSDGHPQAGP